MRRLYLTLAVVFGVLCAGSALGWFISYGARLEVRLDLHNDDECRFIRAEWGVLVCGGSDLIMCRKPPDTGLALRISAAELPPPDKRPAMLGLTGFDTDLKGGHGLAEYYDAVPLWLPALLFGMMSASCVLMARRSTGIPDVRLTGAWPGTAREGDV